MKNKSKSKERLSPSPSEDYGGPNEDEVEIQIKTAKCRNRILHHVALKLLVFNEVVMCLAVRVQDLKP